MNYELRMQCGCTFSDTTLYQVSSIKYQVSSIKYQVSSIKHQASSSARPFSHFDIFKSSH